MGRLGVPVGALLVALLLAAPAPAQPRPTAIWEQLPLDFPALDVALSSSSGSLWVAADEPVSGDCNRTGWWDTQVRDLYREGWRSIAANSNGTGELLGGTLLKWEEEGGTFDMPWNYSIPAINVAAGAEEYAVWSAGACDILQSLPGERVFQGIPVCADMATTDQLDELVWCTVPENSSSPSLAVTTGMRHFAWEVPGQYPGPPGASLPVRIAECRGFVVAATQDRQVWAYNPLAAEWKELPLLACDVGCDSEGLLWYAAPAANATSAGGCVGRLHYYDPVAEEGVEVPLRWVDMGPAAATTNGSSPGSNVSSGSGGDNGTWEAGVHRVGPGRHNRTTGVVEVALVLGSGAVLRGEVETELEPGWQGAESLNATLRALQNFTLAGSDAWLVANLTVFSQYFHGNWTATMVTSSVSEAVTEIISNSAPQYLQDVLYADGALYQDICTLSDAQQLNEGFWEGQLAIQTDLAAALVLQYIFQTQVLAVKSKYQAQPKGMYVAPSDWAPTCRPGASPALSPPPPSPSPAPDAGGEDSGGSGFPVGAVVGGVVGGLAACAAGLALFLLLRSRRAQHAQHAQQAAGKGKGEEGKGSSAWGSCFCGLGRRSTMDSQDLQGSGELAAPPDQNSRQLSELASRSLKMRELWVIPFQELTLLKEIGTGSFGSVYTAMWQETIVAAKVFQGAPLKSNGDDDLSQAGDGTANGANHPEEGASHPDALATLQKEAAIMASLRHPHCLLYLGLCPSPPVLVMEFCPRGSLADVLRQAREGPSQQLHLDWQRRLRMALDAAKGMLYLHSRTPAIIHRDLKSPNLLVDAQWRVKVSDFNLSRLAEEEGRGMLSSAAATNPRWLAPEVLSGQPFTPAADVYSFGIILNELMCPGQIPWGGAGVWQIVGMVGAGQRPRVPSKVRCAGLLCYEDYTVLMAECWAQDPAQRPPFAEVASRLKRLLVEQSRLQGGSRRQGSRRALVQAVRNSFKRLGERGATCVRSREGQYGEEAGGHEGEVQLDVGGGSNMSVLVDTTDGEGQGSPHV